MRILDKSHVNKAFFSIVAERLPLAISCFDSPEEYVGHLSTLREYGNADRWSGGSMAQCLDTLTHGDMTHLAQIERILSQLDISDLLTNNIAVLESSMVGFVPNVGAYLAGHPETMLNLEEIEQPNLSAPIRVYFETSVSAGVSDEQIRNRGIAIMAFVMAMNTIRPVEAYAMSLLGSPATKGTYGSVVKIASAPLDIGRAMYMLTSNGYARKLSFTNGQALAKHDLGHIPWAFNGVTPASNPTKYENAIRYMLDLEANDIVLMGGHLDDRLVLSDPIAWVNKMVRKHSNQEVAA